MEYNDMQGHYDYVIVGSGFSGSVSALRLAEKGYSVLVIEMGKWHSAADFPTTNWNLKRWLWVPPLRWYGIMKLTFFRHIRTSLLGSGQARTPAVSPVPSKTEG